MKAREYLVFKTWGKKGGSFHAKQKMPDRNGLNYKDYLPADITGFVVVKATNRKQALERGIKRW